MGKNIREILRENNLLHENEFLVAFSF